MKNCVTDRRTEGQTHTQRWNSIHRSPMEPGYKKPKQKTTLMVNHSIFLWLNDCSLNFEQLSLKFSLVLNKKGWKEFFLNGANRQKYVLLHSFVFPVYDTKKSEWNSITMLQVITMGPLSTVSFIAIYANAGISLSFVRRTCLHPRKLIMNGPLEQLHIAHYQEAWAMSVDSLVRTGQS